MTSTQRATPRSVNRVDRERGGGYAGSVWRLAVLLLLAVCAGVRADDDEELLETPKHEGLPERLQALEREWAEDVGSKEPAEEAEDEPEAVVPHDVVPPLDDAAEEPAPAKSAPQEHVPPPVRPAVRSPIESTSRGRPQEKAAAASSDAKAAAPAPAAKPLAREPTAPEE